MKKSSSTSCTIAAMLILNIGVVAAEEPADTQRVKPEVQQPESPTSAKEETASPKPSEGDTAKPKDDPNCE